MGLLKRLIKCSNTPRFTRVYSYTELKTERHSFLLWNSINTYDVESLKKIYHHISTASEIIYYCSAHAIECAVNTKKFGWCLLTLCYDFNFTEFGIWRSGTRYDINYKQTLKKYPPLHEFLKIFIKKAHNEYKNDKNL